MQVLLPLTTLSQPTRPHVRICVGYRALNKAMIRNNYPLPRIDDVWDQTGGSQLFSSLDLRSVYNQIRSASDDTHKTCFRTRYGACECLVIPFCLAGVPTIFQSLMNTVLRPYLDKFCLVYLNDILIYSLDDVQAGNYSPSWRSSWQIRFKLALYK
jgi:Reverse transcriptase (RNA-dependent DNA polymerase)